MYGVPIKIAATAVERGVPGKLADLPIMALLVGLNWNQSGGRQQTHRCKWSTKPAPSLANARQSAEKRDVSEWTVAGENFALT